MHIPQDDYLWPFAGRTPLIVLSGLIVLVLVFFNLFPGVDVAVSRLFFVERPCAAGVAGVCGSFPLSASPIAGPIREVFQAAPVVLAVLLLLAVIWRLLRSRSLSHPFDRAGLAAVAALILGAGVLVNLILKEYWGRPRPVATDLFGGPFPFVPAGHITDYCASNCSFVSGEAAGTFWLVALAALAPRRYRMAAFAVAFVTASATALLRIAFGGHYLSDVTLAALSTLFVFSLIATAVRHFARRAASTGSGAAKV